MVGSFISAFLAACGRKTSFSTEMMQPYESKLGFPLVQVAGEYALDAWEHLSIDTTISPVIIGDPKDLLYISESLEYTESETVEEIIIKAKKLKFPSGLKAWRRAAFTELLGSGENNPEFKALFGNLESIPEEIMKPSDILADWPRGRSPKRKLNLPSLAIDWRTDLPLKTVVIALIPTSDWTEVPAYLRFGGYNDCPSPEWHVAALRYWRDINSARLIGVSHETLDLRVGKQPETREEAAQQAIDLYEYCPDIIDQGTGSFSELARGIMQDEWWSLWWD